MAIYTKTGDRGKTGLVSAGKPIRTSKNSARINAIGVVDEVNSYLGLCIFYCKEKKLKRILSDIQDNLFAIGAYLAKAKLDFSRAETKKLEREIDRMEGLLPVLQNFILPGGSVLGANLHIARTITRRVERAIVALNERTLIEPEILQYVNRLSDYLFVLARSVNLKNKQKERVWKKWKA